ncbi:hypothetical protein HK096_003858, partial [Nowakowskiella sp. JEL0078]
TFERNFLTEGIVGEPPKNEIVSTQSTPMNQRSIEWQNWELWQKEIQNVIDEDDLDDLDIDEYINSMENQHQQLIETVPEPIQSIALTIENVESLVSELFEGVEGIEDVLPLHKSSSYSFTKKTFTPPRIPLSFIDKTKSKTNNALLRDAINLCLAHIYMPFTQFYSHSNLFKPFKQRKPSLYLNSVSLTDKQQMKTEVIRLIKGMVGYSEIHKTNFDALLIQEIKLDEQDWKTFGRMTGDLKIGWRIKQNNSNVHRARRLSVGSIISSMEMKSMKTTPSDVEQCIGESFRVRSLSHQNVNNCLDRDIADHVFQMIWEEMLQDTVDALNVVEQKKSGSISI